MLPKCGDFLGVVFVACNTTITIKHILIECAVLVEVRKEYFEERSLFILFPVADPENFYFLPERDWYVLQSVWCAEVNFV